MSEIIKADTVKKFEKDNHIELPRDDISEIGVIGTLLTHPSFILKSDFLKPNNFMNRELGATYHAISSLSKKGCKDIDVFMVLTVIENDKAKKQAFIDNNIKDIQSHLIDLQLVARDTVEEYNILAKNVISCAFRRDSYIKLHELAKGILSSNDDINATNYKLQNDVSKFANVYICNKEIKTLGERADDIWESIKKKRNTGFFGYPSMFSELNKYATYEPTELLLICASSKVGKSQVLMNESLNKAMNGIPTLYGDTELSTENHLLRVLANLTGIENRRIKEGKTSIAEEKLIQEKLKQIKKLPYTHIYMPNIDMDEFYMIAKQLKISQNLKFVSFDYIKYTASLSSENEHQALGAITDRLKNQICGELELAGLGSTQLDRDSKKISGSSLVERYASTVCYLHRKSLDEINTDGSDGGNLKLSIKFNRNGAMTEDGQYINLVLNGDLCRVWQAKKSFTDTTNLTPYD